LFVCFLYFYFFIIDIIANKTKQKHNTNYEAHRSTYKDHLKDKDKWFLWRFITAKVL